MTDRELLELAAKAAGIEIVGWPQPDYASIRDGDETFGWSPLIFDSDALRLAVKLRLDLLLSEDDIEAIAGLPPFVKSVGGQCVYPFAIELLVEDPYAATRRAIVRAAAEIGMAMQC